MDDRGPMRVFGVKWKVGKSCHLVPGVKQTFDWMFTDLFCVFQKRKKWRIQNHPGYRKSRTVLGLRSQKVASSEQHSISSLTAEWQRRSPNTPVAATWGRLIAYQVKLNFIACGRAGRPDRSILRRSSRSLHGSSKNPLVPTQDGKVLIFGTESCAGTLQVRGRPRTHGAVTQDD